LSDELIEEKGRSELTKTDDVRSTFGTVPGDPAAIRRLTWRAVKWPVFMIDLARIGTPRTSTKATLRLKRRAHLR